MNRLRSAINEGAAHGIPEKGVRAFLAQEAGARARGIEFQFTLPEWWEWWQTDDRWAKRGSKADSLVMARHGDVGPYHPASVYCTTNRENVSHTSGRTYFKMRKSDNGQTRHVGPVETPRGVFPSVVEAAKAHGVSHETVLSWIASDQDGWKFAGGVESTRSDIFVTVALRLRELRTEAGLTQAQLAKRAGVMAAVISDIELGTANPTIHTLTCIAAAFGQDMLFLLSARYGSLADAAKRS